MEEHKKFIDRVRSVTPDWIRWNIGPYTSYMVYFFRIYILGNPGAPKVLSVNDTLDLILRDNLSVIRFGDGEMSLIKKSDLIFQKADEGLAKRLKEVMQLNVKGLLICIPGIFGKLDDFNKLMFRFSLHHQFRYRHDWLSMLSPTQIYGNTLITRPYLNYKPGLRLQSGEIFKKLFSIWQGKKVVLIEGAKSRTGVGNNMFGQAVSVSRILCPPEDAYAKYKDILAAALKFSKEHLILISLGPTAKVLAYDLFLAGYRVIDIGHTDMEYEMFVRKEAIETKVRYKYFGEIHEKNPEDCIDPQYLGQIAATIN